MLLKNEILLIQWIFWSYRAILPVEWEPSFRQYRATLFCLSDYLLWTIEFVNALPLLWCKAAFTNSMANDSIRKCKTIAIYPGSWEPDCWIKVFQNIHSILASPCTDKFWWRNYPHRNLQLRYCELPFPHKKMPLETLIAISISKPIN